VTGCVEVGSGEGSELDAVECWLLSLLSVSGVWQAETVAAADTRCKVAFSTTALCSAAGASDGAVTVGGVVGERVGLHGSDGAGDGERDRVGVTGSRSVTTRMVKRGGTETGVRREEEAAKEMGSDRGVNGGVVCDVSEGTEVDRTISWKDVDSTLDRAEVRLE
jgi:hypothetical protein